MVGDGARVVGGPRRAFGDFARTPAGVALAEETAPSAGVLRAVEGTNGHVPFFAPPLAAKVSSAEGAEERASRLWGEAVENRRTSAGTVGLARRDIGRSSAATPAAATPTRGGGDAWTTLRFDDDERSRDVDVDADGMDADGGDGETTEMETSAAARGPPSATRASTLRRVLTVRRAATTGTRTHRGGSRPAPAAPRRRLWRGARGRRAGEVRRGVDANPRARAEAAGGDGGCRWGCRGVVPLGVPTYHSTFVFAPRRRRRRRRRRASSRRIPPRGPS